MTGRITKKLEQIKRVRYLKHRIRLEEVRQDIVRCGNNVYGGFDVAGSVVEDNPHPVIYSFGIGEDLSFSEAAMQRWNCDVYAFDPTPRAVRYVKAHPVYKNERFHFYEIGLSDKDGTGNFHLPSNGSYVSGSFIVHSGVMNDPLKVKMKTLSSIMKELGHDQIDVLKMDIEGSEFPVFYRMKPEEMRFSQLCVEVHDRFFEDGGKRLSEMFKKLQGGGV